MVMVMKDVINWGLRLRRAGICSGVVVLLCLYSSACDGNDGNYYENLCALLLKINGVSIAAMRSLIMAYHSDDGSYYESYGNGNYESGMLFRFDFACLFRSILLLITIYNSFCIAGLLFSNMTDFYCINHNKDLQIS